MIRFRKVAAEIWGDRRFRSLSESAQRLWFYLLTGPEVTNLPGVVVIGRAGLSESLGWSTKKLDRVFLELSKPKDGGPPMATADWSARVVWLPNGFRHNPPANPSVVAGWRNAFHAVPECGQKSQIRSTVRAVLSALGDNFVREFEKYAQDGGHGWELDATQDGVIVEDTSDTVPPLVSDTVSDTRSTPCLARVHDVRTRAATSISSSSLSEADQESGRPDTARASESLVAGTAGPAAPPVRSTPDADDAPPPWFVSAVATVSMTSGVDLVVGEAWLRYRGHRENKGIAMKASDAKYWLTTVMVREARQDLAKRSAASDPLPPPRPKPAPKEPEGPLATPEVMADFVTRFADALAPQDSTPRLLRNDNADCLAGTDPPSALRVKNAPKAIGDPETPVGSKSDLASGGRS